MRRLWRVYLAVAVMAAACGGTLEDAPGPSTATTSTASVTESTEPSTTTSDLSRASTSAATTTTATTSVTTTTTEFSSPSDCPREGRPWDNVLSVQAVRLSDTIMAAVYPLPDREANLWSQWGQGIVLDDGRFLSAVGDHQGRDGNSYLFVFDPATRELTLISDVLSLSDHQPGDWGFGKVHAQMVRGPCADVLVTSYWGTQNKLEFGPTYDGDILISIDPQSETVTGLGTLVADHGVPSLAASPDAKTLFAEAVDPKGDADLFVAFDLDTGGEIFRSADTSHVGFRAMAVDLRGRAYYSIGNGHLRRVDPHSGETVDLEDQMPGESLRASTPPDELGTILAVTKDPPAFFTLDATGSIESLGRAPGYTTSLARVRNLVYFMPDAHGAAWESGAPIMVLDVATGKQSTLLELGALVERELGLRIGGTYDIAVDPKANRLFVGLNAAPVGSGSTFGQVVLIVVDL